MAYTRARSKQAMQKLITRSIVTWGAGDSFKNLQLTDAAGFDDECVIKRIRCTVNTDPDNIGDENKPVTIAILQTPTNVQPIEADMLEDNLVVVTGMAAPGNMFVYDHTITMRKLSGSSLWLCTQYPLTPSGTPTVETYTQIHYVES